MAQTEQVAFVDVETHDLLEELIQSLVRVRHDKGLLAGKVPVDVGDDLHGHVRLTRARRSDHQRQAGLHARLDRLDLSGREADAVADGRAGVRPAIRWREGLDTNPWFGGVILDKQLGESETKRAFEIIGEN